MIILNSLLRFLFVIFPYQLFIILSKIRDRIYSAWISNAFYSFGNRTIVCSGCILTGGKHIKIGEHVLIEKHAIISCWEKIGNKSYNPSIVIGDDCSFGDYLHLTAINRISIGKAVLTGKHVTITDNSHGETDMSNLSIPPKERKMHSKGPVIIEDNVWIGDKATILSGVTIGTGSVVGANSVVTKDVPPYSIVAGAPAKVIKSLA